jgi:hypothetical protein
MAQLLAGFFSAFFSMSLAMVASRLLGSIADG